MATQVKSNLSTEQRLQKNNFRVINHIKHCAVGGVVMFGNTSIDDATPTAYTDGKNVVYGRRFIEGLTDPQMRFLILHENYHKALRHLTLWKHLYKKNPQLANIACDHVINLQLIDIDDNEKFIEMPPKGCADPRFRGMDAGQVFRILEQEQQDGQGQGQGQGGGGFDEHGWDEASEMSEAEQHEVREAIDQALRQGAIIAGKRNGQMPRGLGELLEPQINWREALREFVMSVMAGKDQSTWRTVNRRFLAQNIYMPGSYSETVGRIVIGVDTSGSIDNAALREFLSEVKAICDTVRPELIDLLYWDSGVARHEKYSMQELDTLATSTKPAGGGGTSPSCVTTYLRDHNIKAECAVMFTDGHVGGDWGSSWPCPVMWVINSGNKVVAPVGKTIHLD